jgi:uncharacterized protein YecE (DUF72 family)
MTGGIRVGIGGWTFEPWRGPFYPAGLPRAQELSFASRQVTSIEINGTFYRTQSPASFRKWAAETPDDFVFSVKASRYSTYRSKLAEAGDSIARFVDSGLAELGDKLGPLLWQVPPTTKFDEADFAAFLGMLPRELAGRQLRHAVELRHPSFGTEAAIALLRRHGVALVYDDSDTFPAFADETADFVYARLQRSREDEPTGYAPVDIEAWAARGRLWTAGGVPGDLPRVSAEPAPAVPRDCFLYVISGAKVRAPAAAAALLARLRDG